MSATVQINAASPEQLKTLLQLKPDELAALRAARPIASWQALHQLLPARAAMVSQDLAVAKLPLNQADRVTLIRAAGLDPREADAVIAARPFFLDSEVSTIDGVSPIVLERVLSYFTVGQLSYRDKASGSDVSLRPATDKFVVLSDIESGALPAAVGAELNIRTKSSSGQRRRYLQMEATDSEGGLTAMRRLRRDGLSMKSLPSFTDGTGARRYFDPEYLFVQFEPDTSEERQKEILTTLGLTIEDKFRTPGLYSVRQPAAATDVAAAMRTIAALNEFSAVRLVEPAYLAFDDLEVAADCPESIEAAGADNAEAAGLLVPWHLAMIHAADAWKVTKGLPQVIVVLIDTGVDLTHPALRAAIPPRPPDQRWNFVPNEDGDPTDQQGHGTFVAGLLVGDGSDAVTGICPRCRLLPLKVPLQGSASSYGHRRDAILFATSQADADHRIILNLSWKTDGDVALIRDAIEQASAHGCLVVCSAGNWPSVADEPHFPSDYEVAVSAGAVGPDGLRADYSFFGDKVDLAAPGGASADNGQRIASAALGGGAREDFGTSFAAPQIAGAAALVWSSAPNLNAVQVRASLQNAASPLVAAGLGSGLLNCGPAVNSVAAPQPPILQPRPVAGGSLQDLNTLTAEELATDYGLLMITARLILNRRPITRIEDIRGTLGLSDEQYAAFAGALPSLVSVPPARTTAAVRINVNVAAPEELAALPGMPMLTVRLILIKRPFPNMERLAAVLGLPPALLDFLRV